MNSFIDPRSKPSPKAVRPSTQTTIRHDELVELHRLCAEGRLYDVERWIQEGKPLQIAQGAPVRRRRTTSALEKAIETENYALVLLLLCNGYDSNIEPYCPLDLALRARRWDLLALLLEWGANPHRVDLEELFDTYNSKLFEQFRTFGINLSAGHALANTLAHHTSNKPLFGFAKRHREHDPKIQRELNIALAHHAGEGNEKGVQLCLWAGADPHAPACSLRYRYCDGEDEVEGEDCFYGFSAIHEACSRGHTAILEKLGPDPSLDDYDELYRVARSGAAIELLARSALPSDVGVVIQYQLAWYSFDISGRSFSRWRALDNLRRLFTVGARWTKSSPEIIANIRRGLLKVSDEIFVDTIKLFAEGDHCSPDILKELVRTPSMRARMKEVGFIPPSHDNSGRHERPRPTRSREVLKKFGIELPEPKVPKLPLPRSIQIGSRRPQGCKIRLDRTILFERVWSTPISKLAEEWGLSGPGLAKACRRLKIPVPPRGYWAKVAAGKKVRRAQLPKLPPGEAEEIVIWAPVISSA